jgi:tRNA(Ile)-lysidine synthase
VTSAADELYAATAARFPTGPFVVALSGGADSAVLAWLASRVSGSAPVRAVFVNHAWPHSGAMQQAAAAIAAEVGLKLEIVNVASTASEGAARIVRLAALEEAAAGASIVTGHHAGDVAETFLLNVARGAGATGASSIPAQRGPYIRPLLAVDAARLRDVAATLALPFVDDPANELTIHPRNVVRAEILPRLGDVVPGAAAGLVRSASLAAADDAVIQEAADRIPLKVGAGAVSFPAAVVGVLPPPVTSRVVRRALRTLRPPYAGDSRQVAAVVGGAGGPPVDIGDGLRVVREGPFVTVFDVAVAGVAIGCGVVDLPVPGDAVFAGHEVTARVIDRPRVAVRGTHLALVDLTVASDLTICAPGEGDRIDIGGGRKLVADALGERGVPLRLRPTWPLVSAHGKIVWIAGVRLAAWARPEPDARRVIQLTTERR